MKRALKASTLLALGATTASAGGLDRTFLPVDIIFQDGRYGEISFSSTTPSISGTGNGQVAGFGPIPAGTDYDDVASTFTRLGLGVKLDITEKLSAAVLFEQPFGSDVSYDGGAMSSELGGTRAVADSSMITALLRYKFTDRFSAHGGVRIVRSHGDIALGGGAYGPTRAVIAGSLGVPAVPFGAGGAVNGYAVELDAHTAAGFVLGAAYEIPDIALRVALTYNSAITHKFDTKEYSDGQLIGTSTTEVELPQSIALDFQTGVAPGTLVFGQIRWAEWSAFQINPEEFEAVTGGGLVDLDDVWTYTLGVGRQFTDDFSGSFSVTYEAPGDDDLVSPLAPTDGSIAYGLGGRLKLNNGATLSAGIRYTDFGDARPETSTPDTARADFSGNSAVTVGFKLGFNF